MSRFRTQPTLAYEALMAQEECVDLRAALASTESFSFIDSAMDASTALAAFGFTDMAQADTPEMRQQMIKALEEFDGVSIAKEDLSTKLTLLGAGFTGYTAVYAFYLKHIIPTGGKVNPKMVISAIISGGLGIAFAVAGKVVGSLTRVRSFSDTQKYLELIGEIRQYLDSLCALPASGNHQEQVDRIEEKGHQLAGRLLTLQQKALSPMVSSGWTAEKYKAFLVDSAKAVEHLDQETAPKQKAAAAKLKEALGHTSDKSEVYYLQDIIDTLADGVSMMEDAIKSMGKDVRNLSRYFKKQD